MGRNVWVLLIAPIVAAGCAGPDEALIAPAENTVSPTEAAPERKLDPGLAPEWAVGDWWKYRVEFLRPGLTMDIRIVVYGEDGANWLLSSDSRDANILAEFGHYPTLGAWTKESYRPSIHGAKIPLFSWPLADGKAWKENYRDSPADWTAKAVKQTVGGASHDGFDLEMVTGGQFIKYGYAREAGMLTHLEWGFGVPAVRMQLVDYGHNFTETVSVLTITTHRHGPLPVMQGNPPNVATTAPVEDFTVGTGSIAWAMYFGGAPGQYGLAFGPLGADAASQGVAVTPTVTDSSNGFEWGQIAKPTPGQWGLGGGGVTAGGGFAFAEVLEISESLVTPRL